MNNSSGQSTSAHETSVVLTYEGANITFQRGKNVMVNATQMAKPFGKRPAHWLTNSQTKEFLQELSNVRNLTLDDLMNVRSGSAENGGGTWFHQDVALEFARWLSPAFSIWTNDRIKELLTQGVATVSNDDEAILHAINVLQKRVDSYKQQNQILQGKVEIQEEEIKVLSPKAEYTDNVLQSLNTYTMTQMAKELNFTGINKFTFGLKKDVHFYINYRKGIRYERYFEA